MDRAGHPRDGSGAPRSADAALDAASDYDCGAGPAVRRGQTADRQADRAFSFAVLEIDADGTACEPVGSVLIRSLTSKAASGEVGYWVAAHARGLRPNFPTTGTCTALDHGRDR
jgi:hypothetical protein